MSRGPSSSPDGLPAGPVSLATVWSQPGKAGDSETLVCLALKKLVKNTQNGGHLGGSVG